MTLRIGSLEISRDQARIVASVGYERRQAEAQAAMREGADILELRLDFYPGIDDPLQLPSLEKKIETLRGRTGAPLLLTIRGRQEGGRFPGDEARRGEAYCAFLRHAQALDVELNARFVRRVVTRDAKARGVALILSYHDFKGCPSNARLQDLIERGFRAGADLVKLAVTPRRPADVVRLLDLTERNAKRDIVIIAMGALGKVSRVLFPLFGSRLTYGYAGRDAVAPGQMRIGAMRRIMREMAEGK